MLLRESIKKKKKQGLRSDTGGRCSLSRHLIENRHALDMARLREEVESADALDLIPATSIRGALHQDPDIAGLGVHVAADIDDAARSVGQELAQEVLAAAFARRVNDEQSLVRRVWDVLEKGRRVGRCEACVREIIGTGVFPCSGDGLWGDIDPQ